METKDIILVAALLMLSGFSIYRKYVSKKTRQAPGKKASNDLSSQANNDDYEPYSGK